MTTNKNLYKTLNRKSSDQLLKQAEAGKFENNPEAEAIVLSILTRRGALPTEETVIDPLPSDGVIEDQVMQDELVHGMGDEVEEAFDSKNSQLYCRVDIGGKIITCRDYSARVLTTVNPEPVAVITK